AEPFSGEGERRSDELQAVDALQQTERSRLLALGDLRDVVDRAGRDASGGEPRGPAPARFAPKPFLQQRLQLVAVLDPRRIGGEPWVACQLVEFERVAEPREKAGVGRRDHQPPVLRVEGLVRGDQWKRGPVATGNRTSA